MREKIMVIKEISPIFSFKNGCKRILKTSLDWSLRQYNKYPLFLAYVLNIEK